MLRLPPDPAAAKPPPRVRLRGAARPALGLALALLVAGCEAHRDSVALYEKAKSLWEEGQHVDAARTFLTVVEIHPSSPLVEDALYWAANLYDYYLKDAALAERYYQQLMVQFAEGSRYLEAMERLGELYEQRKESRYKAILIYRKLMLKEELKDRRDRFLLRIAQAYLTLGRLEQARLELRQLITEFPKSPLLPQAYYLVGYSYYWEGRKPLAVIAFNQIQKDFPKDPLAPRGRFFVAEIFEEEGSTRKALDVYESLKGRYQNAGILDKRIQAIKARMSRSVR